MVESQANYNPEQVELLRQYGYVTTLAGPVAVLHTEPAQLLRLAAQPTGLQIMKTHTFSVYLDESVPDIGANLVWSELKDGQGQNVTGEGVVIGFVDTGIDVYHPDFFFPNGSSKILYVWDQTLTGRPPSAFGYGYECRASDIQSNQCPEVDTFGHGTHVAGIAASSGMANGKYMGVAPGASIIFVKSGHQVCDGASWTFDSAQILDGLSYIVKKAAELRRRVVINLSLGGNIGSHDGTDPFERALDAMVEDGAAIVVAAGNDAQDSTHVRGQGATGKTVTFKFVVRENTTDVAVDLWYSPDDQFDASLTTPAGETFGIPTPHGGTLSKLGNVTAATGSTSIGRELYFEVNSKQNLPSQGWSVTLTADQVNSPGYWDAWIDTYSCTFPGAFFVEGDGYEIDPQLTIGIPGTAKNVVTVGAYVTKTSWEGLDNETYGRMNIPVGEIAPFSSLGPTRDGRVKPDVVAPGIFIVSAKSSELANTDSDPDQFHRVLAGTSMAAPHVAGVVALMFQYEPTLPAVNVPVILRDGARLEARMGILAGGSPEWGFGKVDARTSTGFFRITLINSGLPKNLQLAVEVDGNETFLVQSDSWSYLYFDRGTEHRIEFDQELTAESGTVYQIDGNQSFTVDTSSIRTVSYSAVSYSSQQMGLEAVVAALIAVFAVVSLMVFKRFRKSG